MFNSKQDEKVRDGFQLETHPNQRIEGHSYEITPHGFYRKNYVMLIEDELYIYYDKENEKFKNMYVISGSYIKLLPGKSLLNDEISQMLSKVYSIEVYIGGRVGSIVLHFDGREI